MGNEVGAGGRSLVLIRCVRRANLRQSVLRTFAPQVSNECPPIGRASAALLHAIARSMKNILFVDDEPRVLLGMRRMLHSMRGEWNMVFAEGAAAAIEALSGSAFDVVVTDMRMPQMDGNELLLEVGRLSPSTVRIVLSGQADQDAAVRAAAIAHSFLAKPCDAETLKEAVRRSCALQELLQDSNLRGLVGAMRTIPTIPRVYEELARVTQDPSAGVDDFAPIVKKDPFICAKLLHLVNSAFFGAAQRIATIEHALSYLGTRTIQQLILNVELFQRTTVDAATGCSIEAEQKHSLSIGELTRRMSAGIVSADHAFTAGMLHDIGRLVVAARLPELATRIERERVATGAPRLECERAVIAATHAEVGAYLMGLWGLPKPVVEAIAFHHRPEVVDTQTAGLATLVHVADALVRESEGAACTLKLDHVERLGLGNRLAAWRELVLEVRKEPA
jgi:HD-like signal output (HDOD) protein/CheY-like chemotaxis protein